MILRAAERNGAGEVKQLRWRETREIINEHLDVCIGSLDCHRVVYDGRLCQQSTVFIFVVYLFDENLIFVRQESVSAAILHDWTGLSTHYLPSSDNCT